MHLLSDAISVETEFWLSQPGILESVAEAASDIAESRSLNEHQVRLRFNVPAVEQR